MTIISSDRREATLNGLSAAGSWLTVLPAFAGVLRPYQKKLLADISEALNAGERRILCHAPTGAGKTHVVAAIVASAIAAELSVLVLATRTRLVRQLHERFDAFAIRHGVIAAELRELTARGASVQVASADTLYRRCLIDKRTPLPSADLVIFDEAHLALGASRVALLECYPKSTHLGFTATPASVSGRPLKDRFDRLILGPTVKALVDLRHLVRPRVFNYPVF
jgi:DNA repair protein RadD